MARNREGYWLPGNHRKLTNTTNTTNTTFTVNTTFTTNTTTIMIRLGTKLTLFNLLSKLVFTALFMIFMPFLAERINTLQTDNDLIKKREQFLSLISEVGIDPFITTDTTNTTDIPDAFGSYNILKEEFISLERADLDEDWNFIEVTQRIIENETIDYRVLNYSFKIDDQTYLLEIGKSLDSILTTNRNIKTVIWFFLIFIILVTLLSDIFYTKKILHPFSLIINKLKGTSTPALFDKIPVKTSTSDFLQLDQTLSDLMLRIEELFVKEREITVNISHELMTPISVIRSKLENLLLNENIDNEVSAKIEESLTTLLRLKTLVNSLLLIARIESQQYLKDESFSILEVLREIILEINPIADDSGISVNQQFNDDLILTNANKSLIFSMFYNVVNNAVKNTPPGGDVLIKSGYINDHFQVIIADTGKGMKEAEMKNLFSRFNKKFNVADNNSIGIGLAITKSIADFHRIEISVTTNIDAGTRFYFFFSKNS